MIKIRVFVLILFAVLSTAAAASSQQVHRLSKEGLKSMLGNPDLIVLDVRIEQEWRDSNKKIQGAIREDPQEIGSWIKKYPETKTLVLYCS